MHDQERRQLEDKIHSNQSSFNSLAKKWDDEIVTLRMQNYQLEEKVRTFISKYEPKSTIPVDLVHKPGKVYQAMDQDQQDYKIMYQQQLELHEKDMLDFEVL